MSPRIVLVLSSMLVLGCLVGLWQAVIWMNHLPVYILPSPLAVLQVIGSRYLSLLNSLWITTEEAAGGLVASILAGLCVSMIFSQWQWLRQTLYPYTILLQT